MTNVLTSVEIVAYAMRGLSPDGDVRPTVFDLGAAAELIARMHKITGDNYLRIGASK